MKDLPEMKELVLGITSYRKMLKLFNIKDEQVKYFSQTPKYQAYLLAISLIRLIFSMIFVIPGNVIVFPLSLYISFYTEQERIKALKSSTVKIKANDVTSSTKVVTYIATFPLYWSFFTYVFNRILRWYYLVERAETYVYTLYFFVLFPIF